MSNTNTISFTEELVKRLNAASATANAALAEAALAAVAQDRKLTVRTFATAIRDAAPCLTAPNAVFTAAVKAAKVDGATLDKVCEAMASALAEKRADDARRAAEKRDAAPAKALQKALAEVEECKLAMRTPLEVARDNLAQAEAAVKAAAAALDAARAKQREAKAALAAIEAAEAPA